MHDLFHLLLAAALASALARATRLPLGALYLAAGVVASAFGFVGSGVGPDVAGDGGDLTLLLVIGASILVFVTGTELAPARAGRRGGGTLRIGLGQFLLLGGFGAATAGLLGYDARSSAFLALALAASSTLIGVHLLHQRREFHEPLGRLVLGVLLLQDAFVLLSLPLLTAAFEGPVRALLAAGGTALLALAAWVVGRWVALSTPRAGEVDLEGRTLLALALLVLFVVGATLSGLPAVTGAFLAGVALAALPVIGTLRAALVPLTDFARALFFTALGAVVPLPTLGEFGRALVFTALVLLLTPPLVTILAERRGYSARTGIVAGLLLAQTSELSLIVTLQGVLDGVLDASVFTVVALVTLFTMALTPFIVHPSVTGWMLRLHPLRKPLHAPEVPHGHVLLLGCGSNGAALLDLLVMGGHDVTVVEQDPALVDDLREAGLRVLRGDAGDAQTLAVAAPERARVVLSTLRRVADNEPVLRRVAGRVPVLVRVFEPDEGAWVRALGGVPIDFSKAAADEFMAWWTSEGEATTDGASVLPIPG